MLEKKLQNALFHFLPKKEFWPTYKQKFSPKCLIKPHSTPSFSSLWWWTFIIQLNGDYCALFVSSLSFLLDLLPLGPFLCLLYENCFLHHQLFKMAFLSLSFLFERRSCNGFHGAMRAFRRWLLDKVMTHFSDNGLWTRWWCWEAREDACFLLGFNRVVYKCYENQVPKIYYKTGFPEHVSKKRNLKSVFQKHLMANPIQWYKCQIHIKLWKWNSVIFFGICFLEWKKNQQWRVLQLQNLKLWKLYKPPQCSL